ncbi:MAG: hypothetical protein HY864_00820 [Chloroflexi bacterium]|nr:hypothetical protein [Chloroflexota bacterium]
MVDNKKIDVAEMKAHAKRVMSAYGRRDSDLYARYREMYFMEDEYKRPNNSKVDEKDWAITVSPSSRNEVVGMVRLLDTSEIHITARSGDDKAQYADKIEKALKTILRVSGEYRRARIESDAALSAVLYGPVVLYSESIGDLMAVTKNPYKQRQMQGILRHSPFLIRSINPEQSYPEWGEFGLLSHIWKYKLRGSVLNERWDANAKPDEDYTVNDIYDCENRLVYCDEMKGELFAGAHGLNGVPVISRYAGGSSLFSEPERQMGSFLYSKAKSRLDKRENALLTAVSTAINMRGLVGPLLAIDPDNVPESIRVEYAGGVRYIIAKAQQVDDKIIDPVIFQWRALLKEIGGESTIQQSTLGFGSNDGTFSGLAMLSSAGKLPLVDSQRAIEMSFRDVFLNILQRIKDEGIENTLIAPNEIPDDLDLEVSLEPNLPQDKLRNAQVAQSLGDLVSDEWKHSNLLQIGDSDEMRKQTIKEAMVKAIVGGIVQNPEIMKQMVNSVMGMPSAPPQPSGGGMPTPPPEGGEGAMPPMPQEGFEQMPQTDPMNTDMERM